MSSTDGAPVDASACGKVILCGEHAVVHGQPAIALPVGSLRTTATIAARAGSPPRMEIFAPDINARFFVDADPGRPLSRIVHLALGWFELKRARPAETNFTLTLISRLPVGSHLGSGAAASIAAARAVALWCGLELPPADASELAFEIEKIHHGTPSGIDNTTIAFEQPVWFVKGSPPELLPAVSQSRALAGLLVIADAGFSTPTRHTVAMVRDGLQRNTLRYTSHFEGIGAISTQARAALLDGDWARLGGLMNDNHELLQELDVSCRELDGLCATARKAGALGAKMSGGGRGGNIIALARDQAHAAGLRAALLSAGAAQVFGG